MRIEIKVNTGNYETIGFTSDNLPIEEAYIQLKEQLQEWAGTISRCSWWIEKINQILLRRNVPK